MAAARFAPGRRAIAGRVMMVLMETGMIEVQSLRVSPLMVVADPTASTHALADLTGAAPVQSGSAEVAGLRHGASACLFVTEAGLAREFGAEIARKLASKPALYVHVADLARALDRVADPIEADVETSYGTREVVIDRAGVTVILAEKHS